jgi:hypothetical protein
LSTSGSIRAAFESFGGPVATQLAGDPASDTPEGRLPAGEIAFQARLTPASQLTFGAAEAQAKSGNLTTQARTVAPLAPTARQTEAPEEPPPLAADAALADDGPAPLVGQKPRQAADVGKPNDFSRLNAGRKTAPPSAIASPGIAPDAQSATGVRGQSMGDAGNGPNRLDAPSAKRAATADGLSAERPAPDPPPVSTTARELRFAVGDGGQRVEVRVAERGGEVHVAVHTPDERLAGSLRDDLPALSAKLESAGLRTETWHAGSSNTAGRERLLETPVRTSQNSQEQPGQGGRRQHDDPPPQRPKRRVDPSHPQSERKDFQWLFNSLQ